MLSVLAEQALLARILTQLAPNLGVQAFATATQNKAAAKKFVQKVTTKKKSGNKGDAENDPRTQAVIKMLTKPSFQEIPHPKTSEEAKAATEDRKRTEEYLFKKIQRNGEWMADMRLKHQLQMAAIKALPPALRAKASEPDLTPIPPGRQFFFDTPPEAYRDVDTAAQATKDSKPAPPAAKDAAKQQ